MNAQPQLSGTEKKEEISFKELLLKVQEWCRYLLRKWIFIVLAAIIGAGAGYAYSVFEKAGYIGEVTFVLEEGNKGGALGSYAGVASQLGIDLGSMTGMGSNGLFTGDNILTFLKSRLIVEKVLLSPVVLADKEVSIADFYIDFHDYREKWKSKPLELQQIHFTVNPDHKNLSRLQDSVLNVIYKAIIDKELVVAKPDKKLDFISVKCTSINELFSKIFVEDLLKEAAGFYVETKTKRSKTNVDKLQSKADSIAILLNARTYDAAMAQDLNLNPARSLATVKTEMVNRDKLVLQTMYSEVVKNLFIAKMSMAQETPVIQIVDTPILPLEKKKLGKAKGLVIGLILGGILAALWFTLIRIYKTILGD